MRIEEVRRVDKSTVFEVPAEWWDLPADLREGLCWWKLVESCVKWRHVGYMQAVSPLTDVSISVVDSIDRLGVLRHLIDRQAFTKAVALLNVGHRVAVCRYSYMVPAS